MKTFFKRLFSILMLSLLVTGFVCQFANAESISEMSNEYFVQDNANVMTYKEIDLLADNARNLYYEYNNTRVMVVTISKLNGESIKNAAIRIVKENGMDTEGRDILILLSVEDKTIHILLGEDIKNYITVSEAKEYISQYATDDFENGKYSYGLMTLQYVLIDEIEKSIQPGIEKNEISTTVTFTQNEANDDSTPYFELFIIALIMIFCGFAVVFAT